MSSSKVPFRSTVTCPHCWASFPLEEIVWISESPDLTGDLKVGSYAQLRFLPTAFNIDGRALDLKGFSCRKLACPSCHLPIPRVLLEFPPYIISIVGAPASGKSYFLAAMTWRLRHFFPKYFSLSFSDADAEMNTRLQEYEERQFSNNANAHVLLDKTPEQGDLYDVISLNGTEITFPKPFLFSLCPINGHFNFSRSPEVSLAVTVYDNAGESFLSNADNASLPVTRHLGIADCIFFLFDPLQDNRFQKVCSRYTTDPQLNKEYSSVFRKATRDQRTVLAEMINRVRSQRNMGETEQCSIPVFVIVTKFDAWEKVLSLSLHRKPWGRQEGTTRRFFLLKDQINEASDAVRSLLTQYIPDLVGILDQFSSNVTYVPVSATGGPPEKDPSTGVWGFHVGKINPFWVEVPLLYALANNCKGIIPLISEKETAIHKNK